MCDQSFIKNGKGLQPVRTPRCWYLSAHFKAGIEFPLIMGENGSTYFLPCLLMHDHATYFSALKDNPAQSANSSARLTAPVVRSLELITTHRSSAYARYLIVVPPESWYFPSRVLRPCSSAWIKRLNSRELSGNSCLTPVAYGTGLVEPEDS